MRLVNPILGFRYFILVALVSLVGFESVAQVPGPPTDLYVISLDTENELFWTASATASVTYNIYRSLDSLNFTQIASNQTVTSYLDQNLINDVFYFYRVTAFDGVDESDPSNVLANTDASTPQEKLGNSIQFDGVDDYFVVNDERKIELLPTNDISIEFWVRFQTVNESYILDRMLTTGNTHYYEIFLNSDSQFEVKASLPFDNDLKSTTTVEVGVWYHVALTFDFGTKESILYINGLEESKEYLSNPFFSLEVFSTDDKFLTIGAKTEYNGGLVNHSNFLDGQLTELRLWRKMLSPTEISASKDAILRGDEVDLIGLWHFNNLFNGLGYCYTSVNTNANSSGGPVQFSVEVEADDDNYTIFEDESTHLDIRLNDDIPVKESVVTEIEDQPDHGSVVVINRNSILYTPDLNYIGSDVIEYLITDTTAIGGRYDNSQTAFVNITVTSVNDAPNFTKGVDQEVSEDSGDQTVTGWATSLSTGPTDESTQTLSFDLTNDNNGLFLVQPSIDASGVLSYTSASDASGTAAVEVVLSDNGGVANGGVDESNTATFSITVTSVNDAPSFTKGSNQEVTEDSGAQTVTGWATSLSTGPADESGQTLSFDLTNDNNGLFLVQPSIDASGTLSYTSASNANGTAAVEVVLSDNGGVADGGVDESNTSTFSITVTSVNDAPSFTKGFNQEVTEDSGAQTVTDWATSLSTGPADESGQTLSFDLTNDNSSLFSVQPSIDASGVLSYTPASDANGTAAVEVVLSDNGGVADGGVDESATVTFNITVTIPLANDAPSFTKGADQEVNEDSGAQTVTGWATSLSTGPPDESGQILNFGLINDNNGLFSVQPSIDASGTLSYTPASDANGTAVVEVVLSDNGGVANGGVDKSSTSTFNITVISVNDAPSFTKGPNERVNEDSGAQIVAGWLTSLSTGPSDESGQTLSFDLTNDNNGLFSVQPSIDASGTLSYTPASDANGTASVEVILSDNGGVANGGVNESNTTTFNITVTSVNDAPSFTKGSDVAVEEGSVTITFWASEISTGSINESTQTLSFIVTNDRNDLFLDQPAIDVSGNLTFTSMSNTDGSSIVSVTLEDNGGEANGGINSSIGSSFTVAVAQRNDAPEGLNISGITIPENEPLGSHIGVLSTIDVDSNDSHTYTLFGEDDEYFELTDNVLTTKESFDFENKSLYNISIRTTDLEGLFFDEKYNIEITNINEPPIITPQGGGEAAVFQVDENTTAVATVSAMDVDLSTNLIFDIVGGEDQSSFTIVPETGVLTFVNPKNYENPQDVNGDNAYNVIVNVSDGFLTDEQNWTIDINEINEPPTKIELSEIIINENTEIGHVIGTLSSFDEDTGESHVYSIEGGIDGEKFNIVGEALITNALWDFEEYTEAEITIRSLDSRGAFFEQLFEINILDVNEAPTDITLSNNTIFENEPAGTLIGNLVTLDEDLEENHVYTIIEQTADSFFFIEEDNLYAKETLFRTDNVVYNVTIQSEDKGALFIQKELQIFIEQNTDIGLTIPTAFTPNGDNENDHWEILNLDLAEECTMRVFDRYGKTVFESNGYEYPWDGSYRGKKLPKGTYYYALRELRGGKDNVYNGFVVIM